MRLTFDDDQRVLEQGFAFRPAWWQRTYLPGAWSGWLDNLPQDPREVVPGLVEVEVAVPRLSPASW